MRLTNLSVTNYRALRDVSIRLSKFGCLIGENNSGKSSVLQAVSLFFSGTKLASSYFFDANRPIRIAATFDELSEADLARLSSEHRARVAEIVRDNRLTLVRVYDTSGKSSLLYNTPIPNDARFSSDDVASLLKGQRPGPALVNKVLGAFPELTGRVDATMNQEAIRQRIRELADSLPEDQKTATDQTLPTGIDKSIEPMLPDPIYIPAVKDLSDDIKTTESTPFGKILGILLQAVEPKLPDAQRLFEELNAKLNRVQQPDGTFLDGRLEEVKLIESTVERYVRESFADVGLRISIPPPELKTVFASARIFANDGVDGLIDSKGDGLRRAIVFSILRSYVELKARLTPLAEPPEQPHPGAAPTRTQTVPAPASYLLLFEEPELFLHPKAQHILFGALRVFAREHHVLVTTHSPTFFGPGATETFVKLRKASDTTVAAKPFTLAQQIDLSDMTAKDQFQIICFENNNAAFFADTVVLVEGDSDYLLMPHIARTLDSSWDAARAPIVFARITGKGNIRRYREFFSKFGVRVPVIADLDLLLGGFDQIAPDDAIKAARDRLLARADALISADKDDASAKSAKSAHASGELRGLWQRVKDARVRFQARALTEAELDLAVDTFFAWQRKDDRLAVLMTSDDAEVVSLKHELLEMLRTRDVYVLERGAIEQYYPSTIAGSDKPSRAQDFCAKMATREAVLGCCAEQTVTRRGAQTRVKEFDLIFAGIFGSPRP